MFKDKEELSALQEFKSGRLYPTLRVTRGTLHGNPTQWPGALGTMRHCRKCIAKLVRQSAGYSRL